MDKPTMQTWEEAWLALDVATLKSLYAEDGVVIPPNQVGYEGPEAIINFFGGGVGSIHVTFHPDHVIQSDVLAYEYGTVKDYDLKTQKLVEMTKYAVTYAKIDGDWRILFHTWTVAIA